MSRTKDDAAPLSPSALRWFRIPHRDLVVSSGTLFGTTVVTSVLGFAYWSLVARSAPAAAVGAASAMISALTLLGSIGMFGFGTVLIAELARAPGRAKDLLPASIAASCVLSLLLSAGFVAVGRGMDSGLRSSLDSPVELALFIVGVALTSATLVFDQAAIGLSIGQVQLWRNSAFAVAKVVLVPLITLTAKHSEAILATWVFGLILSVVLVLPDLRRRGIPIFRRPRMSALTGLGWVTFHHNLLNLALTIPRMAVPVVVATFLPGEAAAAFYAAWMIASFLYLVPTHLSTSLFAIAAGDTRSLYGKMRLTLGISVGVGVVAVPAVVILAEPMMLLFGRTYARYGSACLVILALLYLPQVVKQHYAAVLRVLGRVRSAGILTSVAATVELLAVVVGAKLGGLTAIAELQGLILVAEALLMMPAVVRALRRPADEVVARCGTR
jgi:O-antigen/teichoic acid export membrane protein